MSSTVDKTSSGSPSSCKSAISACVEARWPALIESAEIPSFKSGSLYVHNRSLECWSAFQFPASEHDS